MNVDEKKILMEINDLYFTLTEEPTIKWTGKNGQEPCGHNYCQNAEILRDKVFKLYYTYKPEYLSSQTLFALENTCNKEVKYVAYFYEESLKKFSSKRKQNEFIDSINKANRQIYMDLFTLFIKIKEIKRQ